MHTIQRLSVPFSRGRLCITKNIRAAVLPPGNTLHYYYKRSFSCHYQLPTFAFLSHKALKYIWLDLCLFLSTSKCDVLHFSKAPGPSVDSDEGVFETLQLWCVNVGLQRMAVKMKKCGRWKRLLEFCQSDHADVFKRADTHTHTHKISLAFSFNPQSPSACSWGDVCEVIPITLITWVQPGLILHAVVYKCFIEFFVFNLVLCH